MSDLTVSTEQAIQYLTLRNAMAQKATALPFAASYIFNKIDGKLRTKLTAYFKAEEEQAEKLVVVGQATKLNAGGYQIMPEGIQAFAEVLAPLRAKSITLTNVRKVTVTEMGDISLTPIELSQIAPFITDIN